LILSIGAIAVFAQIPAKLPNKLDIQALPLIKLFFI
jgi:hypothetical protein